MTRLVLFSLLTPLLSGCLDAQPPPSCRVVSTQDFTGNPPYLALLTTSATSAACTPEQKLKAMRIGVQDYAPPGNGEASLVLRPGRLVDMARGKVFRADIDGSNNCQAAVEGRNPPRCETCGPTGTNVCRVVDDAIVRVDPNDRDGKKLNAVAPFSREPAGAVCSAPTLVAEQNFEALSLPIIDAGLVTLPALRVRYEFSDVKVRMTAEVPGTAFTATLGQTEGNCVATYDVVAFYPAVDCTTDTDCDPSSDVDAGRLRGSGINPSFDPACDLSIGACVPRVDVTKPGLPKK
jgi:hypothetical protein